MVGATIDNILMVEGEMKEVSEADMLEAMKLAHDAIKIQCKVQLELMEMAGKSQKRVYSHEVNDEDLRERIKKDTYDKCYKVARSVKAKHERSEAFKQIKEDFIASLPEVSEIDTALVGRYFHDVQKDAVRTLILDESVRLDGSENGRDSTYYM
jgi:polyribonucleotide nucleotidyltransferase